MHLSMITVMYFKLFRTQHKRIYDVFNRNLFDT